MAALRVLLSYRRDDSAHVTDRLHDRLETRLRGAAVLKDVTDVPVGMDWRQWARTEVERSDVVVAVIGPEWQGGEARRLHTDDDPVRIELEAALARDVPIVPVLVGGAAPPAPDDLPESLRPLAYRNAIPIRRDPDFATDVDRLIEGLLRYRRPVERSKLWEDWRVLAVAAAVLVALLVGGFVLIARPDDDDRNDEDSSETSDALDGDQTADSSAVFEALPAGDDDAGNDSTDTTTSTGATESTTSTTVDEPDTNSDTLQRNAWLESGDVLQSSDGSHRLTMTGDGFLEASTEGVVWWESGGRQAGSRAILQPDGNLVIYPSLGETGQTDATWSTGTAGAGGDTLMILDEDGEGAIRILDADGAPIWAVTLVPDVVGEPSSEVIGVLRSSGVSVSTSSVESLEEVGVVISQDPPPGRHSDAIDLVISAGVPESTTTSTTTTTTTVPPPTGAFGDLPDEFANGVDAALTRAGQLYLFAGDSYVLITDLDDGVDNGFPQAIGNGWLNLSSAYTAGIDAGLVRDGTTAYFFDRLDYVRFSLLSNIRSTDTPVAISGNWRGMPSSFHSDLDAAIEIGGVVYLFQGSELVAFTDVASGMDDGYPITIASQWSGLPSNFRDGIDAAAHFDGATYLFDGSEYVRITDGSSSVDSGYPRRFGD